MRFTLVLNEKISQSMQIDIYNLIGENNLLQISYHKNKKQEKKLDFFT